MDRAPKPLDPARLRDLALAYAARFATSAGKLTAYLARKVRERGWDADAEPAREAIERVVAAMVAARYVDDETFARARGSGLLRRGYGARRIDETLRAAGIAEPLRGAARGSERERRLAALTLARKRGFGPFSTASSRAGQAGSSPADPARREKQVAAMLRAGHPLASARELVDATSVRAAEEWASEGDEAVDDA